MSSRYYIATVHWRSAGENVGGVWVYTWGRRVLRLRAVDKHEYTIRARERICRDQGIDETYLQFSFGPIGVSKDQQTTDNA